MRKKFFKSIFYMSVTMIVLSLVIVLLGEIGVISSVYTDTWLRAIRGVESGLQSYWFSF